MLSRRDGLLQWSEEREGKWRDVPGETRVLTPAPLSRGSCGLERNLLSLPSEFIVGGRLLVLRLSAALAQPHDSGRRLAERWEPAESCGMPSAA